MARTNKHGIRHRAKGMGKKWRPSPNDPALEQPKRPASPPMQSIRDVFKKKR